MVESAKKASKNCPVKPGKVENDLSKVKMVAINQQHRVYVSLQQTKKT